METSTFEQVRTIRLDNGEKLPTLDEYLAKGKELKIRLVLEMKSLTDLNREDECVAKIVRKLKHYGLLDRTDIIAFSICFNNMCTGIFKGYNIRAEGYSIYAIAEYPVTIVSQTAYAGNCRNCACACAGLNPASSSAATTKRRAMNAVLFLMSVLCVICVD